MTDQSSNDVLDDTEYMLTTVDNPYSPFDDFQTWLAWDIRKGYHSTELLGRMVGTSDEQTASMLQLAINRAIDDIVEENVTGMFKKVSRESFVT